MKCCVVCAYSCWSVVLLTMQSTKGHTASIHCPSPLACYQINFLPVAFTPCAHLQSQTCNVIPPKPTLTPPPHPPNLPQMLGLQLANYIPGGEESLNRADWAGVISRQGPMLDMVTQFVAQPVLAMAGDLPETAPSAPLLLPEEGKLGRSWLPPPGSPQRLYLLAALTAGVAVAAGVAVVVVRRRRGGR